MDTLATGARDFSFSIGNWDRVVEESGTRSKWRDCLPPTGRHMSSPGRCQGGSVKEEKKLQMVTVTAIELSSWDQKGIF